MLSFSIRLIDYMNGTWNGSGGEAVILDLDTEQTKALRAIHSRRISIQPYYACD